VFLLHVLHIVAQHGRLHATRADHVVRNQQQLLALQPGVRRDHRRQGWQGSRIRVVLQQKVQHGHEVALAAAEAAVQIGGLTALAIERAADEPECFLEAGDDLLGDHVVAQRRVGIRPRPRQA
jgi:hypothetical protein